MSEYDHLFAIAKEKKNQEYVKYLEALHNYLYNYVERVKPLLDITQELDLAHRDFEKKWSEGTFPGWPVNICMNFFRKSRKKIKLVFYL